VGKLNFSSVYLLSECLTFFTCFVALFITFSTVTNNHFNSTHEYHMQQFYTFFSLLSANNDQADQVTVAIHPSLLEVLLCLDFSLHTRTILHHQHIKAGLALKSHRTKIPAVLTLIGLMLYSENYVPNNHL
jgi:hypothetical protein